MSDALSDLDSVRVVAELEIHSPEVVGQQELDLGVFMS
jgi:hypothetical protein